MDEGAEDLRDVAASLRGDEAAYARLVRRYEQGIAAQMWRFTRDPAVLEELVQEVFVGAYTSLPRYAGRAPFAHWLRRIATHVGYRHWKRQARAREAARALAQWRPPADDASPSEAAEYVAAALAILPPPERLVLTLLYFEDCDTREIARRMGWSRTLVKVRAYRARQKLRAHLEAAGHGRVTP